jgi:GxxExxY protein
MMQLERARRKANDAQEKFPLKDITKKIIGCGSEAHSALGPGLLESMYEEAFGVELKLRGIEFERQKKYPLSYKGTPVGRHRVDVLVEHAVIVELKAVDQMNKIHEAQLLVYLKALDKKVGLLINFNVPRLRDGIQRMVL